MAKKKPINKKKIIEHGRKSNQPSKVIPKNAKGRYDAKITAAQVSDINRSGRTSGKRYPPKVSHFLHNKIDTLKSQGVSIPQSIAIAYDQARRKFGTKVIPKPNPENMYKELKGVKKSDIDKALDIYYDFHDREADSIVEMEVPANSLLAGKVLTELGSADTITYGSDKWNDKKKINYYIHKLGESCKLYTNGTELLIADPKGRLKVKPEGITG
ncbi:MAG: hypothetical protein ACYDDA_05830 [Acidiferrobacteraceae bacterium]